MRTVAVDFDGVIHGYSRGWQDGDIYDPPLPHAFESLRALRQRFRVVIYTTRAAEVGPVSGKRHEDPARPIREWFIAHGAPDLADLEITDRKPLAVAYIDDRAIRFESWQQAGRMLSFLELDGVL